MAGLQQKIYVVLWKHAVVRRHNISGTLTEIVVPVLFTLYVLLLNREGITNHDAQVFESLNTAELLQYYSLVKKDTHVYYAPSTSFTNQLMNSVDDALQSIRRTIVGMKNENDILHAFDTSKGDKNVKLIGIIFNVSKEAELPKTLKYQMRSKENLKITETFQKSAPEGPNVLPGQYADTGIGVLQLLIDTFFIDMIRKEARVDNKDLKITRFVQKFPHPPSKSVSPDSMNEMSSQIMFGFTLMYLTLIKNIVNEKESGVKEIMKLNSLETWMLFTCWLIDVLFINMIPVICIILLLTIGIEGFAAPLIQTTDATLLWTFFTMYCISSILFIFAISSFFENATTAYSVGGLLSFVPLLVVMYAPAGRTTVLVLCLFPQGFFFHLMLIMWQNELRGYFSGLQWNNVIFPPVGHPNHVTIREIFIMYFVGIIIFILITLYMDAVNPGKYGAARPWNYLCNVCCPSKDDIENLETDTNYTENFETPPDNLTAGIRIKNLSKVFAAEEKSESKVAVNDVTLDIYHGEITALLGHNGAGKTTLMYILSGMSSATSGSVMINDYDIKKDKAKIHKNLGLCPQQSILIPEMTVEEHLIFFGMLKGLSNKAAKDTSNDILNKLDFADKRHCLPSKLSGGMKRKLALAIALVGDSTVLILDEPTSGMDAEIRRQVWNVLLSLRGQKTILLSTHYMEEADVLGDRVAIMDHGKIKCYGTTLFLKKLYGTGYNLYITKLNGCNESEVLNTITKVIPEAQIKKLNGPVMSFSLPLNQTSKYPKLFDSLDGNKKNLHYGGYAVSLTTLEDVFLNIGKESENESSEYGSITSETNDESHAHEYATDALTKSRVSWLKLILKRFTALLLINVMFTYRKAGELLMLVIIVLFCAYEVIIISLKLLDPGSDFSDHEFLLNNYGTTEVFVHPGLCHEDLIQFYKKEIESTNSRLTVISNSTDLKEVLLHQAVSNVIKFREKIIVAAEFKCHNNSVQANSMYSNLALHAFPISLNIMSNTLLNFFSNDFSIIFSYHQLITKEIQEVSPENTIMIPLLWMMSIPYATFIIMVCFVELPVLERVSKSKQLKCMAGVSPITYWLSHFLWDIVCYCCVVITLLLCIIVVLSLYLDQFTKLDKSGVLFMLLILNGFAGIPFAYLICFLSGKASNVQNILLMFNFLLGEVACIAVYFLALYNVAKKLGLDNEIKVIDTVLHLIPAYTMTSSIKKYVIITIEKINCMARDESSCEEDFSFFAKTLPEGLDLTHDVMFFGIDCLLFFFILLLIEFGFLKKVYTLIENCIFRRSIIRDEDVDDDVKEEELRVKEQVEDKKSKDALLVYNLVKKFRRFPAVKGISFGVSEGECFGLLGTNGAGKTTIFQILTGDILPTSGKISAFGYKLSKNKWKYLSHIGYSPQFDALDEHLTGHETLSMYAKLRGVPDNFITSQINSWINLLGLNEYCNKVCGKYSGGTKRKLSAAAALIGNPPLVFLDEPTTGVDPVSRRKLWNVLGKIHMTGQAVILTSHSMEECEALCTRLAIMVTGRFMCVGNTVYLKQKFGEGFTVMIKMKSSETHTKEVDEVKSWFQEKKFPNICVLKDEHLGLLEYQITDPKVTLKQLFTTLEEMKTKFKGMEDYAVNETALEQIFLSFARKNPNRIASV